MKNMNQVVSHGRQFVKRCSVSCQKLISRLGNARSAVLNEFRQSFSISERMLRLAVNEAEALAWETEFPLLVFPTLAREKVQAVHAWNQHQKAVLLGSGRTALAAG